MLKGNRMSCRSKQKRGRTTTWTWCQWTCTDKAEIRPTSSSSYWKRRDRFDIAWEIFTFLCSIYHKLGDKGGIGRSSPSNLQISSARRRSTKRRRLPSRTLVLNTAHAACQGCYTARFAHRGSLSACIARAGSRFALAPDPCLQLSTTERPPACGGREKTAAGNEAGTPELPELTTARRSPPPPARSPPKGKVERKRK